MGFKVTDKDDQSNKPRKDYSSAKPHPIDVHVGSRVRIRRGIKQLSQEKLGKLLGLTFQQIQKYEKGTNRIGASRLYEISQILAVPVQFFYDDMPMSDETHGTPGFSESESEPNFSEFLSSREGIELNRAFQQITDPKVRRNVIELVRAMADKQSD